MNNRSLHALNMHKKLFTALNESDTETEIPDVYIQVPDHIPSSHFHHNDSCSHMRKNSKKKKQPPNYNKIAVNVMCVVLENVGGQGLIDEAIGAKSERCNSGGPSISASCIVM